MHGMNIKLLRTVLSQVKKKDTITSKSTALMLGHRRTGVSILALQGKIEWKTLLIPL
jgi:hypothetical protein